MLRVFDELGIEAQIVDAVDGRYAYMYTGHQNECTHFELIYFSRTLNDSYVESLGVKMLEGYADPYHGRSLIFSAQSFNR